MGLIKETIKHPTIEDVEITVDEHAKYEDRAPYDIVNLDITFASIRYKLLFSNQYKNFH